MGLWPMLVFVLIGVCLPAAGLAAEQEEAAPASKPPEPLVLTLKEATMCEEVMDLKPWNPAVVFSFTLGKVTCFSSFDPVPEKTVIYHYWYCRDDLRKRIGLTVNPPRWGTFSRLSTGDGDKGPWRVEVRDKDGRVLANLRFSVTD